MKSAREMFKELGYECVSDTDLIDYQKILDDYYNWGRVVFELASKKFHADKNWESMYIDIPTFKAIVKQCEELGWLDE